MNTMALIKQKFESNEYMTLTVEVVGTPAPARSVVAVADIPLGALVEMDCVACR